MKPPDNRIDASLQAFAKRWIKSTDRPRASTRLGYFFAGLFILFWSSSLTSLLGFNLRQGWGTLVFVGIGLLVSLPTLFILRVMALVGIDRPTRSALLFSAVMGPYIYIVAEKAWNVWVISHILGFAASILAFLGSLGIDRLADSASRKPSKD